MKRLLLSLALVALAAPALAGNGASKAKLPTTPLPGEITTRAQFQQAADDGKICTAYAEAVTPTMIPFYGSSTSEVYKRCMHILGNDLAYTADGYDGLLIPFPGQEVPQ